jgi:hypothetical protein
MRAECRCKCVRGIEGCADIVIQVWSAPWFSSELNHRFKLGQMGRVVTRKTKELNHERFVTLIPGPLSKRILKVSLFDP